MDNKHINIVYGLPSLEICNANNNQHKAEMGLKLANRGVSWDLSQIHFVLHTHEP